MPRRPLLARPLALLFAGAVALSPARSYADKPAPTQEELAAAHELWSTGLDLEKDKKWQEALERFAKVANVKTTPQVRFHIAFCEEHLGRLVEALNGYELALQDAREKGDKAKDVSDNTPDRIAAVKKRIGKVRIHVRGNIRISVVTLDGRPISLALLDTDIPLDPSPLHVVRVGRAGAVAQQKDFSLAEGGAALVELKVDDPELLPPDTDTSAPGAPAPSPSPRSHVAALAVGGAGVALLIGSAVFFGLRQATIANIRDTCAGPGDNNCDASTVEGTRPLGVAYTATSVALLALGGAALATGVALWFWPPASAATKPSPSSRAALGLAPAPGGLSVIGAF